MAKQNKISFFQEGFHVTLVPSPFSVDKDALEDFQDGGQRARFIFKDIWSILPAENVIFSLKCFSFAVYHLRKNGSHLVSSMIDDRDITTISVKHKTATNSYFSFLFTKSVIPVELPEGKSGQQAFAIEKLQKRAELMGANKTGTWCVNCETYQAITTFSKCVFLSDLLIKGTEIFCGDKVLIISCVPCAH